MPQNEPDSLLSYIDELAEATSMGKIEWRNANPTTFLWDAEPRLHSRLSLQRVERMVQVFMQNEEGKKVLRNQKRQSYMLQAVGLEGSTNPVVTIDGSSDAEINEKLESLFELIKTRSSEKSLAFLRSLLPK